ncbi:hypothetical protein Tco_0317568 [Tanacetum coccineum]
MPLPHFPRQLHVSFGLSPVRNVASSPIGGVSQKELGLDSLLGWISGVMLFGFVVVNRGVWSSLVVGAMICLDHKRQNMRSILVILNPSLFESWLSSSPSAALVVQSPVLTTQPASVAVSGVPGDRSHVHTHDHDGSKALDESPDLILSSEAQASQEA